MRGCVGRLLLRERVSYVSALLALVAAGVGAVAVVVARDIFAGSVAAGIGVVLVGVSIVIEEIRSRR